MSKISIDINNHRLDDISCIIFDKDGTLTDSHIYWAEIIRRRCISICKKYKLDLTKDYVLFASNMGLNLKTKRLKSKGPIAIKSRNEVIKVVLDTLEDRGVVSYEELIDKLFTEVHLSFQKDAFKFTVPIKPACMLVEKLKLLGIKLALVTSDSESNAKLAMNEIGLINKFDLILGCDSGYGDKVTGEPARYVCNRLSVNPQEVIAIGDAEMDLKMANNSNLLTSILVASGQIPKSSLSDLTRYTVSDLSELSVHLMG